MKQNSSTAMKYTIHPAANAFPMIEGDEFTELVEDIKRNGLIQPIVLLDDQILDGRNRLAACKAAGVTPEYQTIDTQFPVEWVISANLKRRHLTTSQRAAIAADLANLKHGGDRGNQHTGGKGSNDPLADEPPTMSTKQAADAMNVSPASVKRAKKVKRENPAAHEAAKKGEKTWKERKELARMQAKRNAPVLDDEPALDQDEEDQVYSDAESYWEESLEEIQGLVDAGIDDLGLEEVASCLMEIHNDILECWVSRESHEKSLEDAGYSFITRMVDKNRGGEIVEFLSKQLTDDQKHEAARVLVESMSKPAPSSPALRNIEDAPKSNKDKVQDRLSRQYAAAERKITASFKGVRGFAAIHKVTTKPLFRGLTAWRYVTVMKLPGEYKQFIMVRQVAENGTRQGFVSTPGGLEFLADPEDKQAALPDDEKELRRIIKDNHPDTNPGADVALFKLAKDKLDCVRGK